MAILTSFSSQLQHGSNKVFSPPGVVSLVVDGEAPFRYTHSVH
jgi:hypothetical protein